MASIDEFSIFAAIESAGSSECDETQIISTAVGTLFKQFFYRVENHAKNPRNTYHFETVNLASCSGTNALFGKKRRPGLISDGRFHLPARTCLSDLLASKTGLKF